MTKQEWLGIMSLADDKYIEEADPANYKRKIKLGWKKITAIAASICVFAIALFSGIYFPTVNRQTDPEGFSGGLVSSGGGNPQMLTPYFCGYKFEKNTYDKDNITFQYYYAIDEFIFNLRLYNDGHSLYFKQIEHGKIVDYSVYITVYNYETVRNLTWKEGEDYIQLLLNIGAGETANGIYVHDILKMDENFPFDKYAINLYRENGKLISEYSHSEPVTIPEELIVSDSGILDIEVHEIVIFADGTTYGVDSYGGPGIKYHVNGNQVKISSEY